MSTNLPRKEKPDKALTLQGALGWGGENLMIQERLVVVVYLTPVTTLYSMTNKNPKQNKAAHQSNKNETHP